MSCSIYPEDTKEENIRSIVPTSWCDISRIGEAQKIELLEGHLMSDQVYIFLSKSPKYAVPSVVNFLNIQSDGYLDEPPSCQVISCDKYMDRTVYFYKIE